MESFEQYHYYSQNLLIAQHEVSEIIKHSLTRGEVREDFIIQYLTKTIQGCENHLKRGFVNLGGEEQSGQADILLVKKFAETIDLGSRGNVIVNPEDCLMVVEVKSTLTGTYLNQLNIEAKRVKAANANVVCGMFAYKADLEHKTIMNRFGYDFNTETQIYFDPKPKHLQLPIWYPFIDFILLLDKLEENESDDDLEIQGSNQLYLSKSIDGERYFQGSHNPVVRNLIGLVRSLLIG